MSGPISGIRWWWSQVEVEQNEGSRIGDDSQTDPGKCGGRHVMKHIYTGSFWRKRGEVFLSTSLRGVCSFDRWSGSRRYPGGAELRLEQVLPTCSLEDRGGSPPWDRDRVVGEETRGTGSIWSGLTLPRGLRRHRR